MTNYDRIKNMSIEETADFLANISDVTDNNAINQWFDKAYCDKCPTETITECIQSPNLVGQEWHECEFGGVCPRFKSDKDKIMLWLESEAEN